MNTKLILLLPILLVVGIISLPAQSFRAFKKAGDTAFAGKDYYAAIFHYEKALDLKPDDIPVLYQYAEAARFFHAYERAEAAYRMVIKSQLVEKYPLAAYYLGQVLQTQGKYEEAKVQFQAFLDHVVDSAAEEAAVARNKMSECDLAREMMANPQPYLVVQLDKKINTPYSEFGAMPLGDTLFYSSYRFDKEKDKYDPARKISKVLYSIRGGRGKALSFDFNEDTLLTAHNTFSLDGRRIYFTRCQYTGAAEIRCEIYYKEKDSRNRWRGKPVRLPENINRPDFTTTHPNIGYDSTLQSEVLYYVSDRPGGKGGLDMWWVQVEEGKNKFGNERNLTELNTSGNEITPFFARSNQQLFFSSDGYPGLGGYDIFKSLRNSNWVKPVNLGYPINSSYNDTYFVPEAEEKRGYLASNRPGSFYLDSKNKSCCNDLYRYSFIEPEIPAEDTAMLTANAPEKITPLSGQLPEVTPTIPNRLEDFLPLALYFDNDEPDRRTRRVITKKSYATTFNKYYARKAAYLSEYVTPLDEENRLQAELLMDNFFEEEVKKGYDFLFRFSEILLEKLQTGEEVEIFIKGFTSPRAQSDYNLALGKRRVSSLRNHFETFQDGAFKSYLETKQLVITERSFGETTADSQVSDDLADLRNSVYSIGAARERRVEIVEITRNGG